ncbi:hypothetical protein L3X38_018886 [Prunus dulcis]|uniref:Uncharacterized protein n=1 Tax=Prunus dulcis TaxID=3755 RepID=A0AAD4WA30_PRUDU|nr:hypothetical protein L3X38_018886 [Prunus dulcis]
MANTRRKSSSLVAKTKNPTAEKMFLIRPNHLTKSRPRRSSFSLAVSSSHLFDLFPYLLLLLYSISFALSSAIEAAAVLLQEACEVL